MKLLLLGLLALAMFMACGGASDPSQQAPAPPQIRSVTPVSSSVALYGRFELSADIVSPIQNPFDYDEVHLSGTFTSPAGKTKTVDGFYFQDYTLNTVSGGLTVSGSPQWRLRFTPDEAGIWEYTISFTNPGGTANSAKQNFQVSPGAAKGFLRKASDQYLKNDDGSAFFPIGENIGWYNSSVLDYRTWVDKLAANGGNFIRIWMASWSFGIEWNDTGLGNYSNRMDRAWNLDWVIDHAAEQGVRVQLCLNNHGQVSSQTNPEWSDNPYNAANDGPCANTWDFFTDAMARNLFKNRMRYIIARWGGSASLGAWELFNEVELTDAFSDHHDAVTAWHDEMAQFIRGVDPYKHLVTTSYAQYPNDPATWSLASLDYTQLHYYSSTSDLETLHRTGLLRYMSDFGKPALVGEFGLNTDGVGLIALDPSGINIHNSIWSHTASGAMGAGMTWWWDSYVDPQDLYHHYQPLNLFVSELDLSGQTYAPANVLCMSDTTADITITPGFTSWDKSPQSSFVIRSDGSLSPSVSGLGTYIFGQSHSELRNPPTFQAHTTIPATFTVNVNSVSDSGANVFLKIDGATAKDLLVLPRDTPCSISIQIPAGDHVITVDNDGVDWFEVADYGVSGAFPALRSFAVQSADQIFGWAQNRDYNWKWVLDHVGAPPVVINGAIQITGVPDRSWTLDWYDCSTGAKVGSPETITSSGGVLAFPVPTLGWDLAYRIH